MIAAWFARLNQRERFLALGVGGVLFLLINWIIWSTLLGMSAELRDTYAREKSARKEQTVYLAEYPMWLHRADWLKKHQLGLTNPAEASSLLTQIQQIAGKYKVQIDNPQIGSVENNPTHQAVPVTIETKSAWPPLVHFLYDVQKPDAFIVFESVNLMVDSNDQTVMRGRFKIAKWFAPGSGPKQ
jgi:hypothetical protein